MTKLEIQKHAIFDAVREALATMAWGDIRSGQFFNGKEQGK